MSARRVTLESRRAFRLTVALTAGEMNACTEAARLASMPVATFIAGAAVEAARCEIATHARPDHSRDDDCTVGEDGCCTVCGVSHGEQCGACYRRAFHTDDCQESDLNVKGGGR